MPAYWLLKTEPSDYNFDDLARDGSTIWDGVRNTVALKHMRSMQPGDLALVYHTGNERRAVGIATITSTPYPDPAQGDAGTPVVDLRYLQPLTTPVTLAAVKQDPFFTDFALVRQARLSVVPVTDAQWARLLAMGDTAPPESPA